MKDRYTFTGFIDLGDCHFWIQISTFLGVDLILIDDAGSIFN